MSEKEDIRLLAECGVATVYEASGRKGLVDVPLIQIIPGSRVAGPAVTAACGQDDNLMVHAVIEHLHEGEILVIAMPDPTPVALVGELLATQVAVRKAAGILIDAAVRDVAELVELGLPIWARFIRVRGAGKTRVGSINKSVTVGGQPIRHGDIVVMDSDGAVVVDAARVDEVARASAARVDKETKFRAQLNEGKLSYDLHGLRSVVEGTK